MELAVKQALQWFAQLGRVAWQSSLADKLAEWLSGSIAGKISVGVFAYLLLRSPLDSLWRRIHGYPPGTIGLVPFFSTMRWILDFDSFQADSIEEKRKYGPISMHYAGPVKFVFLNTREACEIAFKKDQLVNRYPPRTEEEARYQIETLKPLTHTLTFLSIDGIDWKKRRKLMLNSVNLDGSTLDSVVDDSIHQVIDLINIQMGDNDFICWDHMKQDLLKLTFSTVYRSSFGLEHFPKDTALKKFMSATKESVDFLFTVSFVLGMPPWMGLKFGQLMASDLSRKSKVGYDLVYDWVDKYQDESVDENRRYVHTLIEEVKSGNLTKEEAAADMMLAFLGASDTSEASVEHALVNAASHMDYQSRVCDELKQAFSDRSEITLKRVQMECPFLQAFVFETLRLATMAPNTVPRVCPEDMLVQGFVIPKGSTVIANTMCISRDKEEWPNQDPNEFYPQRWMIDDHTLMDKRMKKLPLFGYGDRQCPGKNLAVRQFCLLFAHLLYEHEFTLTDSSKLRPLWFSDWHKDEAQIPLTVHKRD